jgi:hypothetical protein
MSSRASVSMRAALLSAIIKSRNCLFPIIHNSTIRTNERRLKLIRIRRCIFSPIYRYIERIHRIELTGSSANRNRKHQDYLYCQRLDPSKEVGLCVAKLVGSRLKNIFICESLTSLLEWFLSAWENLSRICSIFEINIFDFTAAGVFHFWRTAVLLNILWANSRFLTR